MLPLIIKREFNTMVRSKAMTISTLIVILLFLAAGVVGKFLLNKNEDEEATGRLVVGIEQQMAEYEPFVSEQVKPVGGEIAEVETGRGAEWLQQQLDQENTTAIVLTGEPGEPAVVQKGTEMENEPLRTWLKTASAAWVVDNAVGGATPEQQLEIAHAMTLPAEELESSMSLLVTDPVGYAAGLISQMMLMMTIIMSISMIAQGVVEEKASRVVEILLTSVKPRTLLLGKILGIGSYVLLVFLLYIASAVAALKIAGLWIDLDLGTMLVWMVVWLVLGFFLYSTLTGAVSATVSRQEDLGAVTGPISFGLLIPLYLGMFLVPSKPDSTIVEVLSVLPFFSSFMMPVRQAYGVVETPQLFLAAGLAIVTIPLVAALAGKIYENSILRTGKRVKITEAIRGK